MLVPIPRPAIFTVPPGATAVAPWHELLQRTHERCGRVAAPAGAAAAARSASNASARGAERERCIILSFADPPAGPAPGLLFANRRGWRELRHREAAVRLADVRRASPRLHRRVHRRPGARLPAAWCQWAGSARLCWQRQYSLPVLVLRRRRRFTCASSVRRRLRCFVTEPCRFV